MCFTFRGLSAVKEHPRFAGKNLMESTMAMMMPGSSKKLGVMITVCDMRMDVMGLKQEELHTECQLGGVAAFCAHASKSRATLFIKLPGDDHPDAHTPS